MGLKVSSLLYIYTTTLVKITQASTSCCMEGLCLFYQQTVKTCFSSPALCVLLKYAKQFWFCFSIIKIVWEYRINQYLSHLLILKQQTSSFHVDSSFSSEMHHKSMLSRQTCCQLTCMHKQSILLSSKQTLSGKRQRGKLTCSHFSMMKQCCASNCPG